MDLLREKARARGAQRLQCSDSPDTSGMNRAAEANADIAKRALDWYEKAYADQAPAREKAVALSEKVADAQLRSMDTNTALAQDYADYNKSTFRPLERGIVTDAQNFNTEAERERLAGLALGDVKQSFANARESGIRDLTRRGVNPLDGSYRGTAERLALGESLAGADAATKSRQQSITLGRALKMDAASLGRGLPGNQATSASLALNAGNAAANTGQVPLQVANQGAQTMQQGFSTAMQGNNSAGNLYGQAAQIQSRENDGVIGGLGQLAMGAGAMGLKFSDKRMKKDRKPVKGEVALSMARKMPVDSWKYKKGTPADDGGKEHIGPMAQDVHKAGGDKMAPGGVMVDDREIAGVTLAAVRALDKKVSRLEKRKN